MKVKLEVEFEVEPEKELNQKEQANVAGMMVRMARRRLEALRERRLGGEKQPVGWEVTVRDVAVSVPSKVR